MLLGESTVRPELNAIQTYWWMNLWFVAREPLRVHTWSWVAQVNLAKALWSKDRMLEAQSVCKRV